MKTVKEIDAALHAIGYKLDRSLDCKGAARILTGDDAGSSYKCLTTGIKHIKSGLSFAHVDAPRGDEFKTLQDMRYSGEWCAKVGEYILEI